MRSRWTMYAAMLVLPALLLGFAGAGPAAGRPAGVVITPGVGIGPITLGMRATAIGRTLHVDITPKVSGNMVVYDVPSLGLTAWATDDSVVRVRTRNKLHRTRTGLGPSDFWRDGLLGMCSGMALSASIPGGTEITCPTAGIGFEVVYGKITAVSVIPIRR